MTVHNSDTTIGENVQILCTNIKYFIMIGLIIFLIYIIELIIIFNVYVTQLDDIYVAGAIRELCETRDSCDTPYEHRT